MDRSEDTDEERHVVDFGRTAADYERHRPGLPDGFYDRLIDLRWITPRLRALDLGTGTGTLALGFAARGLEATGIDIAPELLGVARRAAINRGLTARFLERPAEATELPGSSFELVSAGQCWWWFDAAAVMQEVDRILVAGGRLLICDFSYVPLPGNVADRTEQLIVEHNPRWAMAGWSGIHPEQVQALDHAGFSDVESFSYVVDIPFSHASWRGRIRTCNGVGTALSDAEVERFDARLADLLADEFPGDLSVPHRVFAASGTKPSGSVAR